MQATGYKAHQLPSLNAHNEGDELPNLSVVVQQPKIDDIQEVTATTLPSSYNLGPSFHACFSNKKIIHLTLSIAGICLSIATAIKNADQRELQHYAILLSGIFSTTLCQSLFPVDVLEWSYKKLSHWSYISFFCANQIILNLPKVQRQPILMGLYYVLGAMEAQDVIHAYKSGQNIENTVKKIFTVLSPTLIGGTLLLQGSSNIVATVGLAILLLAQGLYGSTNKRQFARVTTAPFPGVSSLANRVTSFMREFGNTLLCYVALNAFFVSVLNYAECPEKIVTEVLGFLICLPVFFALTYCQRSHLPDSERGKRIDFLMSYFPLLASTLFTYITEMESHNLNRDLNERQGSSRMVWPMLGAIIGNNLANNALDLPVSFVDMSHPLFKQQLMISFMKSLGWK